MSSSDETFSLSLSHSRHRIFGCRFTLEISNPRYGQKLQHLGHNQTPTLHTPNIPHTQKAQHQHIQPQLPLIYTLHFSQNSSHTKPPPIQTTPQPIPPLQPPKKLTTHTHRQPLPLNTTLSKPPHSHSPLNLTP
ncbi:hypothetical protein M758_1G080400 [Ceratodon purpureus]|nr:hypothetical protein M758_1G080400 [Ceratodon purpureus]